MSKDPETGKYGNVSMGNMVWRTEMADGGIGVGPAIRGAKKGERRGPDHLGRATRIESGSNVGG
jgi:hypothetical protein